MKVIRALIPFVIICLCCCSCSDIEPDIHTKDYDFINKSLPEAYASLLGEAVTLESLESVVGKLTYDYTPVRSAYKTEVYKAADGKEYELEFSVTADGVREIVACICRVEEESEWIFCRTDSAQYGILKMQEGGPTWEKYTDSD